MSLILAIDDQKDNLTTIHAVIKSRMNDCTVLKALSGDEGIKIAKEMQPDVILLDIIMPEMDGYEVCKQLKLSDHTSHIPVIMVTAIKTDSESRIKGLNMGADAFLSKPIDPGELVAQVNVMLRIKAAEDKLRADNSSMEQLVRERTKELKEREEYLQTVFDAADNVSYIVTDINGSDPRIIDFSLGAEKCFGFKKKEVLGKGVSVLHDSLNGAAFELTHQDLVGSMKNYRGEGTMIRKSGEAFPVLYNINPLVKNGQVEGVVGVSIDISELKQIEESLKKSEERFRKAFMTSPDSINITDMKGTYVSVNDGFLKMFEYNEENVIGKTAIQLNNWKNPGDRKILLQELKTKGIAENLEFKFKSKKGSEIDGLISASLIELDGKPHIISITRNITIRKRAEIIQKILFRISSAVIASTDLISLLETIQNELEIIFDATNFFVTSFEHEKNIITILFPANETESVEGSEFQSSLTRYIIQTGKPLLASGSELIKLINLDENETSVSKDKIYLVAPYRIEGELKGIIALKSNTDDKEYAKTELELMVFIADQLSITIERQRAEEYLISALNKAKEADILKSAFLANMSHEIRTPMNGILGFASLLKRPLLDGAKQNQYIEIIEKSGKRMLNLINDLIDISKIEALQAKVSIQKTNINTQMEYLYTFFKPEVENKGMEFNYKGTLSGEDGIILTDKEKLYAILSNLIKNAIKYSNEGSIKFGYELIGSDKNNRQLEFYVKDTGIGIAKDKFKAVFDRFVQADFSLSGPYEGAGLGLSIAKAYTDLLDGQIRLDSIEGQGSQFYVTIPYRQKNNSMENNSQSNSKTSNIERQFNHKTFLIAEDDDIAFFYLSELMADVTENIIRAKNGNEAVEICRNNKDIDIILMDIKMPELNGLEATEAIRGFNKDVIIIAQTAFALLGDKEKTLNAGCNDYISKPVVREDLLNMIAGYLA